MSRWNDWGWYTPAPKRTPPARGIKMKKVGSTWWGRRWIEALEQMSLGYSNRLARGRTYARAGRTHDLTIKAGEVTANVTGSRATPYKVRISLANLPERTWNKAIVAMAGKAQFAADLLAGQMPAEIDAAFNAAGASLFPVKESDLQTSCSCPDWANPCKHVAATHYVLGEAFDRAPFLLFELRGRSKDEVLGALRSARAISQDGVPPGRARKGENSAPHTEHVLSVSLAEVAATDYDTPRAPMPGLQLRFDAPPASGVILMQLGKPPAWSSDTSPVEMLGPILQRAAGAARRLALAEAEDEAVDSKTEEGSPTELGRRSSRITKNTAKKATEAANAAGAETRAAQVRIVQQQVRSKARRKR